MGNKLFVLCFLLFMCIQISRSIDQASFYGNSYISIPFKEAKSSTELYFKFRTHLSNALIILVAGSTDFCIVKLENSALKVNINLGAGEFELISPSHIKLNDFKWHVVSIIRKEANITMIIDNQHKTEKLLPGKFFELNVHYGLIVGDYGNFSKLFFGHLDKFRGCLSEVKYNNIKVLEQTKYRLMQSIVEGVTWNCASEFETPREVSISFVEESAYMCVTHTTQNKEIKFEFDINTLQSHGLLFYNAGHPLSPDFLIIYIWNDIVHCVVNIADQAMEIVAEIIISNGQWHKISFYQSASFIELSIDGVIKNIKNALGVIFPLSINSYFGGLEPTKQRNALIKGCRFCEVHFKGCIRNIILDNRLKGFPDSLATGGLLPGCVWKYSCLLNPCKNNIACVQRGVDSYECVCNDKSCANRSNTDLYKILPQPSLAAEMEILKVSPLLVIESANAIITISNIHVILDYPKYGIKAMGIEFSVTEGPHFGKVTCPHENAKFTLAEILDNEVHYMHDGSENFEDNMLVEVNFGVDKSLTLPLYLQGKFIFTLPMDIKSVNDPPVLDIGPNTVLQVVQGTKRLIDPEIFTITDPDNPANVLTYEILKSDLGFFEKKFNPGIHLTKFNQEDVDKGNIFFVHHNLNMNNSFILLQISDGIEKSVPIQLRVAVIPQYWRIENNTGLLLMHQTYGLITLKNISFVSNVAYLDYKAHFRIIKKPYFGVIEVERNSIWKSSDTFTTLDLKQHTLRYRHISAKPDFDEFQFEILNDKSSTYTFKITFVKCNLFEINTKPIFLNETQEMYITLQYLAFQTRPIKSPPSSIRYVITQPPTYGQLVSTVSNKVLRSCDSFTQEDILSSTLKYRLYQKTYSYVQDMYSFIILSPGCNNVTTNMTIIYYPSLETKSKVIAVLHPLRVEEGFSKIITIQYLYLKTAFLKNLFFNITQKPVHGILQLSKGGVENNDTDFFTLNDLERSFLTYIHDDSETTRDSFKFMSLSPDDNFQYVGEFTILISLKNDNSPVRKIDKIFHIVVGGERLLTGEDLSYYDKDIDTKPTDIVYTCRESPNGYFYNIQNHTSRVTQFTQDDLNNHRIIFKHKGAEYSKVRLWVTDGKFHINGVLEIQASAPFIHVIMNKKLIVQYGKKIVITNDHVSYSTNLLTKDVDVLYEIVTKPSFGKIISARTMKGVTRFTQEDINKGHILYYNDISSVNGDEIGIRARCRDAVSLAQLGVWILPSNYWEPFEDKGSKKLIVEESTSCLLTKKVLDISQTNVPSSTITYYVSELPLNGYLTIISNSNNSDNDLINIFSFTQDLINEKRVLYIQSSANQTHDRISFNVTNGIIWYNNVHLKIDIIPEKIYLGTTNLLVEEGGLETLTTNNIFVVTDYYKRKVTDYVILQDASFGCIQVHKKCNKYNGFSHKELLAGVVRYHHDNSENLEDEITIIAVYGSKRSAPATLGITIAPINDQKPKLINNTGMLMWEGGKAIITNTMLAAVDDDKPKETLYYQILGSWWGNVILLDDSSVHITNFTQDLINHEKVAFLHQNGSEAKFKFSVFDGIHHTKDYYFNIKTQQINLRLVSKPLQIFPLQRKYLTSSHLFSCTSDPDRTVYYEIVTPPTLGRLLMESNSSGIFKVVMNFTQSDLNNTKIFYEHTHQFSDLYANDSIKFHVKAHLAKPLLDRVLKIDISVSSGGLDSYITVPKVKVDEGGITKIQLNLSEVISFLENHAGIHSPIIHATATDPQYGKVFLKNNSSITTFTQQQLENGSIFYKHDHSDSIGDNIHLSLYLIPGYVTLCNLTIPVVVNPINDQPFKLVTTSPNLTVVQGENHTITKYELYTKDDDTPPSHLKYYVISGPNHGKLVLLPDNVSIINFTQDDIDQNRLVYFHNSSVLTDSFHFRVWDEKFRPYYTLFIINVVPITLSISAEAPLLLKQGSDVAFLGEKQFNIDTNANKDKIRYIIKQEPKHGVIYVKNTPSLTFSQLDLLNQNVMFLQTDMTAANDSFRVEGGITSGNTSVGNEVVILFKVQPLINIKNFTILTGEYNRITSNILDASPLAKLTNSNPRYTIIRLPEYSVIRRVIRSSGEKRNVLDTIISTFTHEEVQSGLIFFVVRDIEVPWDGVHEKFVFLLATTIYQPAVGELNVLLKYPIHNDIYSTLAGPNDPAGHEGGLHYASPNMTRDYFLIVTMVIGVIILGVAVIVIIKCRSFELNELKEEQCLQQPIPLPRPPDRLMSSSPPTKIPLDEFSPQLHALPQCKVTPLNRNDVDSQVGYPYGIEEQPDDWSSCDTSDPPCPSKGIMLRRNQYWV